jgi:hypothetical protein
MTNNSGDVSVFAEKIGSDRQSPYTGLGITFKLPGGTDWNWLSFLRPEK